MRHSRRRDWKSGFCHGPCDTCPPQEAADCPVTRGKPCPRLEQWSECSTHTVEQAWPETWARMESCEAYAAYRDGTERTGITTRRAYFQNESPPIEAMQLVRCVGLVRLLLQEAVRNGDMAGMERAMYDTSGRRKFVGAW